MSDDAGFDFDIYTAGDVETAVNGFELAELDLSTVKGSNHLLMQIQGGMGTGAFSGIGDDHQRDRAARAKREAQSRASALLLQSTLQDIQKRRANLGRRLTNIIKDMEDLQKRMDEIKLQLDGINSRISELDKQITHQEEKRIATQEAFDSKFDVFKRFFESQAYDRSYPDKAAAQAIIDDYEKNVLGITEKYATIHLNISGEKGEIRPHIIWQDANGQYYIRNPEDGSRIDLKQDDPQLIGALSKGLKIASEDVAEDNQNFTNMNAAYGRFLDILKTPNHMDVPGLYQQALKYKAELEEIQGTILQNNKELEALSEQRQALEQKLAELENRYDALSLEKDQIEEQLRQLDRDEAELRAKITQSGERLNTLSGDEAEKLQALLAPLLAAVEQESAKLDKVEEDTDTVKQALAPEKEYTDRHDYLVKRFGYSDWQKVVATQLPVWILKMLASDELTEAWNNPLTYEGREVYSDENFNLYFYDEKTQTREYITDPAIKAELLAKAYDGDHGKLFANETPNSKDPKNTLWKTFTSEELTSQKAVHAAESNVAAQKSVLHSACDDVERVMEEKTGIGYDDRMAMCAPRPDGAPLISMITTPHIPDEARKTTPLAVPAARSEDAGKLAEGFQTKAATAPKTAAATDTRTPETHGPGTAPSTDATGG